MRDKTGRSRGFGFLTLSSVQEIDKAVTINLFLDGRKVEAKRAIPKSDMANPAKKIFVGGVPISLNNVDFRKYFETFGKVLETQIMTDRDSGRSRGFGFVTFEEEIIAADVLKINHTIQGKPVEVKQAEPKNATPPQPVQILPINPIYLPSTLSYPPLYGTPLPLEHAAYLVQTQGGVVYVPQLYDPVDSESTNSYGFADTIRRSHTAPVIERPQVPAVAPFRRQVVHQKQEKTMLHTIYQDAEMTSVSSTRIPEPRTERSFSAPYGNESESRIAKVVQPPIKRRFGSQPVISPNPPIPKPFVGQRRTDLNWRKPAPSETTPSSSPPLHKYFQ
jgi:RNA recognition motif-containing protein